MQVSINLLPWRNEARYKRGKILISLCGLVAVLSIGLTVCAVKLIYYWQHQIHLAISLEQQRQAKQRTIRQEQAKQFVVAQPSRPINLEIASALKQLQERARPEVVLREVEFIRKEEGWIVRIEGASTMMSALGRFTSDMVVQELHRFEDALTFIAEQRLILGEEFGRSASVTIPTTGVSKAYEG